MNLGACLKSGTCTFSVWAPFSKKVEVKILSPDEKTVPLVKDGMGYWSGTVENASPGIRYVYRLDDEKERPDPASRFQPLGVHGPSQVIDPDEVVLRDHGWRGMQLKDFIIYEIHTGAFTKQGTFDAIIPHLDYLKELGITVVELMPVAQFPGTRNWGYDGVYPYAVQNSYGGPEGLARLVNACHQKGLAVALDVVYNHLGPEGNYLRDYGPYFSDKYRTPWGDAINFDGPYSDEVRHYFIENALHWITDYHIDALRIDAIHGIFDFSAKHFLQDLGEAVRHRAGELGRQVYVIPESDLNDVRVINPAELGGYGLDAQWNDDFHHAVHSLLTGEQSGYYQDFGKIGHLEKAFREGFVYSGEYSAFRKRRHGNSSKNRPAHQFVVSSQNHDQVGNRMLGDRFGRTLTLEQLKLAAAVVFLSPCIPLLFMGEEYGETAPFQYFVSHSDEALIEAVRTGRREEFASFGWEGTVPDPQDEQTFLRSRLQWDLREAGRHKTLVEFYRKLIALRREVPALPHLSKVHLEVKGFEDARTLLVRRWTTDDASQVCCVFVFNDDDVMIAPALPNGRWRKTLDSADSAWNGPGTFLPEMIRQGDELVFRGMSAAVYERSTE